MCALPTQKRKMVDIHMHLLPGVDDGAEDMQMSVVMLWNASEQGITDLIVTPHSEGLRCLKEGRSILFQKLQDTASRVCPDMKLYLGCEVYCEPDIMAQVVQALNTKEYPTLNGTKYVLMEFFHWVHPEHTVPCVEALLKAGYLPIIAHMERYKYLCGNMELVDRFLEMGAFIQINVCSLFDEMDDAVKDWAKQLVMERKVEFLGTDAHKTYYRPPSVTYGLNWLYDNVDQEYADAIAWKNAERRLLIKS